MIDTSNLSLPRSARRLLGACGIVLLLLAVGCGAARETGRSGAAQGTAPEGRPVEVLFLGHASVHHHSAAYMPILAVELARKGIHLTYVEDPAEALNPQTLKHYDGLLLYANHDVITPDQEKALLDFVASGKGFIPVHSASFCFRNSDAFIDLVGGQFTSHETGTFTAEIIRPDHPALEGVEPFTTWDETYVHTRHNEENRTVLMERVEGDHREPYTWVRTHGKGRVFYTAFGHDERTWTNAGFLKLLEQGILWAVGDAAREGRDRLTLAPLAYTEGRLPNYEKRDPEPKVQQPLSPDEAQAYMHVPAEFRLELFAAEPDIVNPITMAFDEKGRLWVVETIDYPNEVRDGEAGDDRIKILEDTDGDGRADKTTIFAEGLNIPTSLVFANDGVIVAQAPDFLFLKDTDGDDRADVKEVLLTGWGTFDTHAGPSNLMYGPDNRIWGSVGYAGFEGVVGGEPFKFGQGFFRFTPDAGRFEYLTRTSNNTWGLGFSETFDVFGSTANNAPSWYMAIPDRYFQDVKGLPRLVGSEGIADFYAMHPLTPYVRQVDVFGGYTSAAGHHLYTARAFPEAYWNRIALITEPTGHLVARGILEKQGAGFVTKDGWTLLAAADEWVAPVHAQVGPDGAVWVLDWYDFIVQHNPTPKGFETGKGNAYETELRDQQRGRIFRIVYRDAPEARPRSLSKADPDGLIDALQDDNMFWRLNAQRLLVERGRTDVAPALVALTENRSVDKIGTNGAAFHALWTLHGLGLTDQANEPGYAAAVQALNHPAAGVRKAAAQVLPRSAETLGMLLEKGLTADPDLHTRLAALLALAESPVSAEAGRRLYALSKDSVVYRDQWLARAVYLGAARHSEGFLAAFRADPGAGDPMTISASLRGSDEQPAWQNLGSADVAAWPTMPAPGYWEGQGLKDVDGYVWFVRVVEGTTPGAATLNLGKINDNDITWVNGAHVGSTEGQNAERSYTVPASVWKTGPNVVAVRVFDRSGGGGFHGAPEVMQVVEAGGRATPLAGPWPYRVERNLNEKVVYAGPGDLAAHFAYHYGGFAAAAGTAAEEKPDVTLTLRAVRQDLAFDQKELAVKAGALIELVFYNDDLMQHNVVVGRTGTLETIGEAADAMATQPGAAEREYVPGIPEVLAFTPLVDPGGHVTVRFRAPDTPGAHPYVCTFPGHWRVMNGVLNVLPAVP